jgi:hypothetical protein
MSSTRSTGSEAARRRREPAAHAAGVGLGLHGPELRTLRAGQARGSCPGRSAPARTGSTRRHRPEQAGGGQEDEQQLAHPSVRAPGWEHSPGRDDPPVWRLRGPVFSVSSSKGSRARSAKGTGASAVLLSAVERGAFGSMLGRRRRGQSLPAPIAPMHWRARAGLGRWKARRAPCSAPMVGAWAIGLAQSWDDRGTAHGHRSAGGGRGPAPGSQGCRGEEGGNEEGAERAGVAAAPRRMDARGSMDRLAGGEAGSYKGEEPAARAHHRMVAVSGRQECTGQSGRDGCLPASGAIAPERNERWGSAEASTAIPARGHPATAPARRPASARRSRPSARSLHAIGSSAEPILQRRNRHSSLVAVVTGNVRLGRGFPRWHGSSAIREGQPVPSVPAWAWVRIRHCHHWAGRATWRYRSCGEHMHSRCSLCRTTTKPSASAASGVVVGSGT